MILLTSSLTLKALEPCWELGDPTDDAEDVEVPLLLPLPPLLITFGVKVDELFVTC